MYINKEGGFFLRVHIFAILLSFTKIAKINTLKNMSLKVFA